MKKYLAFDVHVFNHENQIVKLQKLKCKKWIPVDRYEKEQSIIRKNINNYLTDDVTEKILLHIKNTPKK